MTEPLPRVEYIEARRVLLDALDALRGQLAAVILVGAQAVYIRTEGRLPGYQPFTTDADLVLDPARLADRPGLGEAMRDAGFTLTSEPGIWEARFRRQGIDDDIVVPIDLIVPERVAAVAGRRAARLGGEHGKNSARKCPGLEGALVDYGTCVLGSLEPGDSRAVSVSVAGESALLVAKLHKLGDRLDKPRRLDAKDAGDVYRLFDVIAADELAARLGVLLADPRSAATTAKALEFGNVLFGGPAATGVRLGVDALRAVVPEPTVVSVLVSYWRSLTAAISDRT
jgi:hypothetical protein